MATTTVKLSSLAGPQRIALANGDQVVLYALEDPRFATVLPTFLETGSGTFEATRSPGDAVLGTAPAGAPGPVWKADPQGAAAAGDSRDFSNVRAVRFTATAAASLVAELKRVTS